MDSSCASQRADQGPVLQNFHGDVITLGEVKPKVFSTRFIDCNARTDGFLILICYKSKSDQDFKKMFLDRKPLLYHLRHLPYSFFLLICSKNKSAGKTSKKSFFSHNTWRKNLFFERSWVELFSSEMFLQLHCLSCKHSAKVCFTSRKACQSFFALPVVVPTNVWTMKKTDIKLAPIAHRKQEHGQENLFVREQN